MFIFGGQTEQGQLLNDVWEWHMDTMHWVQLNYFQAAGAHRWGNSILLLWCLQPVNV